MELKTAVRDGMAIAAAIMLCRLILVLTTHWPKYSWPEMGSLFVAAKILGLGESQVVCIMAPFTMAVGIGAILASFLFCIPKLRTQESRQFRWKLALAETVAIFLPIALLPVGEWM